MVEGGGLGGLGRCWVILLKMSCFWPNVMVGGGGLGGWDRWSVKLLICGISGPLCHGNFSQGLAIHQIRPAVLSFL